MNNKYFKTYKEQKDTWFLEDYIALAAMAGILYLIFNLNWLV